MQGGGGGGCHWPLGESLHFCPEISLKNLLFVRPSRFGLMKYQENYSRCINELLSDNSMTGSFHLHIYLVVPSVTFWVKKKWILAKSPEIWKFPKINMNEPLQILNNMFSNLLIPFYLHIYDDFISNNLDRKNVILAPQKIWILRIEFKTWMNYWRY